MNRQNLKLIEPSADLKEEFLAMAKEFGREKDHHFRPALENFSRFLERLSKLARGINLPPNYVPQNNFWLTDGNRIFGESSLRHYLNEGLRIEGGHIGYSVRPSERRKGYGTLILELTLEKAKSRGLTRVLVTCDTDNVGSAKIIEKNGGRLSGQAVSPHTGKQISQYWIEIR